MTDNPLGLNPIAFGVQSGAIASPEEVSMRIAVCGIVPDRRFALDFLFVSQSVRLVEMFAKCVERGMFLDLFKDDVVMNQLINTAYSPLEGFNAVESDYNCPAWRIIRYLAVARPGILIGYYLRNGKTFYGKWSVAAKRFEHFETFVVRTARELAKATDSEFFVKYIEPVERLYRENMTKQMHEK